MTKLSHEWDSTALLSSRLTRITNTLVPAGRCCRDESRLDGGDVDVEDPPGDRDAEHNAEPVLVEDFLAASVEEGN